MPVQGSTALGAQPTGDGVSFVVWAPNASRVDLQLLEPYHRLVEMESDSRGYRFAHVRDLLPGARYLYRLNGQTGRPDPASRWQPMGVHGPSAVVAPDPPPPWDAPVLRDYVIYEVHVGTFTRPGTFDALRYQLDRLVRLGVTALELMPVAEFPGARNWGYDGVSLYAAHSCYGGPAGFRRLVEACHHAGLAVVLDVVYNHLGPEGNYLREFGPYFTDRYKTPWGEAVNFDGPGSDHVRRFFLENALYWIRDCGVDALRLDAVHEIYDRSAYPFIQELADVVHRYAAESGRNVYLIAESDLNDAKIIRPREDQGFGLDAQWADDLHHSIHALLTGERMGYYSDFGNIDHLEKALAQGWVYSGQYSPRRAVRFGNSPAGLAPEKFVVCAQNHDQVGNRMLGDRLAQIVGFEKAKLAAATYLLSPFTPLIFMGEEYGEPSPFPYFVSHSDEDLQRAVREGRRLEFAAFLADGEPSDPQHPATFTGAKLNPECAWNEPHGSMERFYARLIALRKSYRREICPDRAGAWQVERIPETSVLRISMGSLRVWLNYGERGFELPDEGSEVLLDSSSCDCRGDTARAGGGTLQPFSCRVVLDSRSASA